MADRRFFYLLHRAHHALLKAADFQLLSELNVTSAQMGALFFLRKNDGCLLKELSRGLGLNNSAITGLASRMEAQDLVERRACERDGRASRLYLTDPGREKAEAGIPFVREMNALLEEDFKEEELDAISRFLERVIERAQKAERPTKPPASPI